jgi:Ribosomal protein S3, C-terminal domain
MAQKVNPIAVRLGLNRKSDSSWFSDFYYATLFFQDYHLRNSLNSLKQSSGNRLGLRTAKCIIHHYPKKSSIHLFCLGSSWQHNKNNKSTDSTKKTKFYPFFEVVDRPTKFFNDRRPFFQLAVEKLRGSAALEWPTLNAALTKQYLTKKATFIQVHNLFSSSGWTSITCKEVLKTTTLITAKSPSSLVLPLNQFFSRAVLSRTSFSELGAANYVVMQYFQKSKTGRLASRGLGHAFVPQALLLRSSSLQKGDVFELRATLDNLSFRANSLELSVVKSRHFYLSNLQNLLWNHTNMLTSIKPIQVTSIYQSASLVAQEICFQLEQTKSFRQICKTILKEIEQRKYIKGIRITCSGRLNGAEIAKTECKKYGETSLHVFSDQIDYAAKPASTPYGTLGLKVWISYLQ